MRVARAILVTALLPIAFLRLAWGHQTVPFTEFPITSDFGPRFLTANNRFDFHKAIDWSRAAGLSVPLLEAGSVIRLSYSTLAEPLNPQAGGILIFETVGEHRFRYLHMFNNAALPIDSGDFTLALTDNNRLAIIKWANRTSLKAAYVIAEESGDMIQLPAGLVLNQDGSAPIETINALTTTNNASIGPSGGSGGFSPHMHVDHGFVQIGGQTVAASENPLAHVGHAISGFAVTFLDRNGAQRQDGFIVHRGNADDAFIKIRADTTNGKNLDRVEFLVDGQVGIGNRVRDFQFGGLTSEHDSLNTDVELDPGTRSNGLTDGVVTAGAVGIEEFVYNGWDTAATPSALRPNSLEDGEHTLYACLTNIKSQRFCTPVKFVVKTPPTPTVSITAEYEILFDRLQGKAINIPTSRATGATVFIHDYNSDIDVNTLELPGTKVVTYSDARDRVVQISDLVPGNAYAFSVKNASGGVTQGSWRVENLALVVNAASASFNEAADGFSGTIGIKAESTASGGAERIIEFEPTTQTKIKDWAVGPLTSIVSASRPNNAVQSFYSLRDSEGNSSFQNLEVYEWNYSFPAEPGQAGSRIQVAGNGSATMVLPVPVNAAPGQAGVIMPGVIRTVEDDITSLDLQVGRIESNVAVPLLGNPPDSTFNLTVNGQSVATGVMPNASGGPIITIPSVLIPVTGDVNIGLSLTFSGVGFASCLASSGDTCTKPLIPIVSARPFVRTLQYLLRLPSLGPHIPIFDGADQSVSLGNGVKLSGFNVSSHGLLAKAGIAPGSVEEGNINLLGDKIYEITASDPPPAFTPPFTISLPFDKAKSTGKPARIVRLDPCRLTSFATTADYVGGKAVAEVAGFGRFAVVESKYSPPKNVDSGRCHFVSGVQTVAAEASEGGPGYAQAVNVFRSLGLKTIDVTCKLGPTGTSFSPPGEMKVCYDPAALNEPDITDQDLDLYQFNETGARERLEGMFHDRQRGFVTGSVSRFSSQFGAFAHVSPVAASDRHSYARLLQRGRRGQRRNSSRRDRYCRRASQPRRGGPGRRARLDEPALDGGARRRRGDAGADGLRRRHGRLRAPAAGPVGRTLEPAFR